MEAMERCPECGAAWAEGRTCQDDFHQMLYWEAEDSSRGEVHHLMVLCYHLQHPNLYSPEGLAFSQGLLADFVVRGVTPQEVRRRNRDKVDSGKRDWKIKGTPASHGSYANPVRWTMTAAEVVAAGADDYCYNVRTWARLAYEALKVSGNLEAEKR